MNKQNITVLRKILYAVESGDQTYGKQDYSVLLALEQIAIMRKQLRLVLDNGTQERPKSSYTGFREAIQSCSRIWIQWAWKQIFC